MEYVKELEIAIKVAVLAGKKILPIYDSNDMGTMEKEDKSPITKADLVANETIIAGLSDKFPEYAILSEEVKDSIARLDSEYVWIIDPLDGTKEFIKKNGEFTVNVALARLGEPVLGVIFAPVLNELYYATENKGAFLQKDGEIFSLSVSRRDRPEDMILVKSRSHASGRLLDIIERANFKEIKTSGSSIKGCLVSRGEADIYPCLHPISEWDICAMDLIARESGAIMTGMDGVPLKYNKADILFKDGFLLTNNHIHQEILDIINI
ncbi:MAG: 3'(2'),5'-bisphosphate nucleotidase CysQ [Desulfobacterales bacterium]|nr:3'(2'),5'-bisphosphate nucleotidase CysQ [Desulfobacterales bacterium]